MTKYVGQPIKRLEDERFLQGKAAYLDDLVLPGMLQMGIVRSIHAHARVVHIQTRGAENAPGIVTVLTGKHLNGVSNALVAMQRAGVETKEGAGHPILSNDRVLYVGQPIAVVIGESRAAVEDALQLVEVEYELLPPLLDVEQAVLANAPILHPSLGDNIALRSVIRNGDPDRAFAEADVLVTGNYWLPRVCPAPMEPRGVLARYDSASQKLTVWTSTQAPHEIKEQLRHVLDQNIGAIHVIAPDVGGGFGQKHHLYPEEAAAAYLAIQLGRPVKWVEQRQENFVASHSRGFLGKVEAAVRKDGRILGLRARLSSDLGAYHIHGSFISPDVASKRMTGPYDIQDVDLEMIGVQTNKPPTGPYRGAGQPETSFFMERTIELIAEQIRLDPVEVRFRNLIPPERFPYTNYAGVPIDAGNYARVLQRALDLAEYPRWYQAAATQRDRNRLSGIGIATVTAGSGGSGGTTARSSYARISVDRNGHIWIDSDVLPHGQGTPTTFAQIVADELGVRPADVTLRTGDTELSTPAGPGSGTYASRSLVIGGSAVLQAARSMRDLLRETAAHAFECPQHIVNLIDGWVINTLNPTQRITIGELGTLALQGQGPTETGCLQATHIWTLPASVFSFAAHVAVVEVDTTSGAVSITKYVAVHDCGPTVNPMIVRGQIMGGIAQGIGEALQEAIEYDEEGRASATSLMTYGMPLAEDIPDVTIDFVTTPSTLTPTGVRGVGEAPSVASPIAIANAVMTALTPLGVRSLDLPLTPDKVWMAIHDQKGNGG